MSPKPTAFIREREGYYWVLAEYESNSEPGKMYEVRTSQRDGKTYCTCRGWVMALNKTKATQARGEAVCTHIRQFRMEQPAAPIVIMNFDDFVAVKRGIQLISDGTVKSNVSVRRK